MFKRKFYMGLIILVLMLKMTSLQAQNKYWVFFTDKNGVTFNPYTYFDIKAIERRLINNVSLYDETDYPLDENYIQTVAEHTDSVTMQSRWFNGLVVYTDEIRLEAIKQLPFVASVEAVNGYGMPTAYNAEESMIPAPDEELLKKQLTRMGGQQFAENNIHGKGVRIAVFDAGFPHVDTHEAFAHLRDGKRILKTWDFIKKRENVYGYSSHGTSTLSCIAGMYKGTPVGLATEAEFLLARTEMSSREPYAEEENWLAAAEWADKNGADIISSSLGYTYHRYFTKDMDGKKSLVSRAANMAASKGILVVNSAGNEGNTKWKFIGAPADADSVLSIGGIDPESDYRISFSSYGPTADKRMKPNVCSFGTAFVANENGYGSASGTSFSCPLISGFAACAWQTHRNLTNMELFKEIEKSGDLYPYFDYAHGFGVPQASYFVKSKTESDNNEEPPFTFEIKEGNLEVSINGFSEEDTLSIITDEKENLLFYNIQKPDNTLRFYYVIAVYSKKPLQIDLSTIPKGDKINLYYKRHLETYQN